MAASGGSPRGADEPMDEYLRSLGLHRKSVAKDGSCLFRAVAEQVLNCQSLHGRVRAECVDFLRRHRDEYEAFIEGDFEGYLSRLQHPQQWVGEVEINALSSMYRRDFLIFQEPGKPAVNIASSDYGEKVQLCFLHGNHYDSVFPARHLRNAALCQSILYELLYGDVFKVNRKVLVPCLNGAPASRHLSDDSMSACGSSGESDPEDAEDGEEAAAPRTENGRNTTAWRHTHTHQTWTRGRGRGRPLSERVRRSLNPTLFRNIEFDVWQRAKRDQQRRDFNMAAGMQYTEGDSCQVNLEGHVYNATIQEVPSGDGLVTVYTEELGKLQVPLWSLQALSSENSWRTIVTKDRRPSNGDTEREGRGRGRRGAKPPPAPGGRAKSRPWPPNSPEQGGAPDPGRRSDPPDPASFGLTEEQRLLREEEKKNLVLLELQLRDEDSFPALGSPSGALAEAGRRKAADRMKPQGNKTSPVKGSAAPPAGDSGTCSSPPPGPIQASLSNVAAAAPPHAFITPVLPPPSSPSPPPSSSPGPPTFIAPIAPSPKAQLLRRSPTAASSTHHAPVRGAPPPAARAPPTVQKPPPPTVEAPPIVVKTLPLAVQAPPPEVEAPPTVAKALPPAVQAPPPAVEAPPPVQKAPPPLSAADSCRDPGDQRRVQTQTPPLQDRARLQNPLQSPTEEELVLKTQEPRQVQGFLGPQAVRDSQPVQGSHMQIPVSQPQAPPSVQGSDPAGGPLSQCEVPPVQFGVVASPPPPLPAPLRTPPPAQLGPPPGPPLPSLPPPGASLAPPLQQLFQDPLFPGFPPGERGLVAPTPPFSCSATGEDLPRDLKVLRFFFNLGVKAYLLPLHLPYSYLLPLQQAHTLQNPPPLFPPTPPPPHTIPYSLLPWQPQPPPANPCYLSGYLPPPSQGYAPPASLPRQPPPLHGDGPPVSVAPCPAPADCPAGFRRDLLITNTHTSDTQEVPITMATPPLPPWPRTPPSEGRGQVTAAAERPVSGEERAEPKGSRPAGAHGGGRRGFRGGGRWRGEYGGRSGGEGGPSYRQFNPSHPRPGRKRGY